MFDDEKKEYDWKDSNLALFGSDQDKKVKKESAMTEPAWKGTGQKVGIEIWRINKFKVEKWPKEDYGKFYSGDSYIVMNTWKEEGGEELHYDIHFWIGKYSTQDEYATAAYKTVELDAYHDDKPIQHREVQGNESNKFKEYFDFYTIMKGGCDTGFRRVGPTGYKSRLFQVVGEKKQIAIFQVPMKRGNLNSEDVFILDMGLRIYQFNGETATKDEKFKATQYVNIMRSERQGKPRLDILDEKSISSGHRFYKSIPEGQSKEKSDEKATIEPGMFKIREEFGNVEFKDVLRGSIDKNELNSDDVYIVSTGERIFAWIGRNASIDERRNMWHHIHAYCEREGAPLMNATVVTEGQEKHCPDFLAAF